MKRTITIVFLSFMILSCNSNSSGASGSDTTTHSQDVQNVNGNIPDTSNSIPIQGKKENKDTDRTYADTAGRKGAGK